MAEGIDVIGEIPADRWDVDKYWNPDPHNVGTHVNRRAGFLENVHDFDHTFFNISPREAGNTDVQQRNLLEVTQEALDDAGQPSEKLPRTTGVYIGIGLMDHGFTVIEDAKCMNAYTHTGTAHSVAANRVSFAYDIRGPSVAIDTACAASLTAMHYACFGLWNKECPVAIVGGCNTLVVPEVTSGFSALGVLAADGKSCPFSAQAKGYVRSEGMGACIVKPLETALRDNDNVYCIIRGSWLAHSGYSLSITMPSTDAQAELMKTTYAMFGLNMDQVDFVEAHGTGTPVGDPIEAEAIARAFTIGNITRKAPLAVGSSKSHFGHLECAAGMAQIVKVALMLKNREIYPNIHFGEPNPAIDCQGWNIYVPEELVPFKKKKTFTCGINTFGFGGALAHMVFEEYTPPPRKQNKGQAGWKIGSGSEKGLKLMIPLTAKSGAALKATAKVWEEYERPEDAQEVVCWLATRRSHYNNRVVILADSGEDFRQKLKMVQEKVSHEEIVEGTVPLHQEKRNICFIFPGQGQQSFDMGRSLYRDEAVFRKAVDDCDAIYKKISGKSFIRTYNMFGSLEPGKKYNTDSANDILVSQPAILFLQVGLLHLMECWGINASCVVGHSLGEVAAAYASGTVTLEEAITVQYYRALQQDRLAGTGSMAALRVSPEEGQALCKVHKDLFVACVNAHRSITLAGGIKVIKEVCAANPDNARELRVKCAFHTPHMNPIEVDFLKSMKGKMNSTAPTKYAMYSTVTGTGKKHETPTDTQYFWDNIRGTVHFLEAIQGVMRDYENVVFLELSGAATLLSSIRAIAKEEGVQPSGMISCGQRGRDDRISTQRALATLYTMGTPVDWDSIEGNCGHWMQLPHYAWQHQTFRYEAEGMRNRRLDLEDRTLRGLHGEVKLEILPYLRDHVVNGSLKFPRSGFIEYALEMEFDAEALPTLRNIVFHEEFLEIPEEIDCNGESPERRTLSLTTERIRNGSKVSLKSEGQTYAKMDIHMVEKAPQRSEVNLARIRTRCKTHIASDDFYAKFDEMGVQYEDEIKFKNVKEVFIGDGEALACLHPLVDKHQRLNTITLDAAFMVAMSTKQENTILLTPTKIDCICMAVPTLPRKTTVMVYAKLTSCNSLGLTADITLLDEEGNVFVDVKGFRAENISGFRTPKVDLASCLFTSDWQPMAACLPPTSVVRDFFKDRNLKRLYPQEMVAIEKAEKHLPLLKEICAAYAKHAVASTPESEYHQTMVRCAARLRQIAETIPTKLTFETIPKAMQKINNTSPEMFQEMDMIRRMGQILPESLKDPKPALSELFKEDMMGRYFLDSISTRIYYKALGDLVRQAVLEAKKQKKVVRVLEMGGRLGGLTQYILTNIEDLLQDGSVDYTFTDINITFFHLIEEKFAGYPNMKYAQLDVERGIDAQSFAPNSYDIVVCLDTLHCTKESVESCSIIRDLLCQDGWLMIMEPTNNHNSSEIIFGCFELCWIFEDQRKDRCWMDQKGWTDVMIASGFSDITAISTPNEFFHSLFVGRKSNMELVYPTLPIKSDDLAAVAQPIETTVDPIWVLVHLGDTELPNLVKSKLPKGTKMVNVKKFESVANSLGNHKGGVNVVYFWNPNDAGMVNTLTIVKTCQNFEENSNSALWVITEGAASNGGNINATITQGLLRSLSNEMVNIDVFTLDLDEALVGKQADDVANTLKNHTTNERELRLQNSRIHVPRIVKQSLTSTSSTKEKMWRVEAAATKQNCVDSIGFHVINRTPLQDNMVRIAVKAANVSTFDVKNGTNAQRQAHVQLGQECVGVVEAVGRCVKTVKPLDNIIAFGIGCMASNVDIDAEFVFQKPPRISSRDSAGIGLAYVQAYHTLIDRANLQYGERILINSACSSVGLAALELAKFKSAKVICAVDTEQQRHYLKKNASIAHITDTSSSTFHRDVLDWTEGLGVDVVVNFASGEAMDKSLMTLANGGRFCHMADDQDVSASNVAIDALLNNCSLHTVRIDTVMKETPVKFRKIVTEVLGLLQKGAVQAIPTSSHDIKDVKIVLEQLKESTPIGNVVLEVPTNFVPCPLEPALDLFKSDALYLITGATGGIGQEFARWMAEKGARHIAFVSSRGSHSWFHSNTVDELKAIGTTVYDFKVDLCDEKDIRRQFSYILKNGYPPLKGVFHLAGVHRTSTINDLSVESLRTAVSTKATSARIISQLTTELRISLDHFVMLSSSKSAWGNPELAEMCAANSGLDGLAQHRRLHGLPALSLQCGWLRGAGWLEDSERSAGVKKYTKGSTLHVREFLSLLDKILLNEDLPPVIAISNEVS